MDLNQNRDEVVAQLVRRNTSWRRQAFILRIVHALLGISATVLAIAAGVIIQTGGDKQYGQWFAFAAAGSSAILAFFSVESKGNRMRRAERVLTAALFRYEDGDKKDPEQLIKAYEEGERIIGDVTATGQSEG